MRCRRRRRTITWYHFPSVLKTAGPWLWEHEVGWGRSLGKQHNYIRTLQLHVCNYNRIYRDFAKIEQIRRDWHQISKSDVSRYIGECGGCFRNEERYNLRICFRIRLTTRILIDVEMVDLPRDVKFESPCSMDVSMAVISFWKRQTRQIWACSFFP